MRLFNAIKVAGRQGAAVVLSNGNHGIEPNGIEPTELNPHGIEPTRDWTRTGLNPHGIEPAQNWTQTGLHPQGIEPAQD